MAQRHLVTVEADLTTARNMQAA